MNHTVLTPETQKPDARTPYAATSSEVPRRPVLERILKRAVELAPQLAAREAADMLDDLAGWKVEASSCSCSAELFSALRKRVSHEGAGDQGGGRRRDETFAALGKAEGEGTVKKQKKDAEEAGGAAKADAGDAGTPMDMRDDGAGCIMHQVTSTELQAAPLLDPPPTPPERGPARLLHEVTSTGGAGGGSASMGPPPPPGEGSAELLGNQPQAGPHRLRAHTDHEPTQVTSPRSGEVRARDPPCDERAGVVRAGGGEEGLASDASPRESKRQRGGGAGEASGGHDGSGAASQPEVTGTSQCAPASSEHEPVASTSQSTSHQASTGQCAPAYRDLMQTLQASAVESSNLFSAQEVLALLKSVAASGTKTLPSFLDVMQQRAAEVYEL